MKKKSVKKERQQKVYKQRKVWKKVWRKKGRNVYKERKVRKKVWRKKGSKKFIKKERYERKCEEWKAAK